jgi:hypothetical protein
VQVYSYAHQSIQLARVRIQIVDTATGCEYKSMLAHIHCDLMEFCWATNAVGGGGGGFVQDSVFIFHVCVG